MTNSAVQHFVASTHIIINLLYVARTTYSKNSRMVLVYTFP